LKTRSAEKHIAIGTAYIAKYQTARHNTKPFLPRSSGIT